MITGLDFLVLLYQDKRTKKADNHETNRQFSYICFFIFDKS